MPKANGKHFSYTRTYGGKKFHSSGRTFTKADAKRSAKNMRAKGTPARVQRLGSTNRYAIYARRSY